MVRYSISFSGNGKPEFNDYADDVIEEAKANGMIVLEECVENELKLHKTFSLYSEAPLDDFSVIAPSRIIGNYYLFDFPKHITREEYKTFKGFILSVFQQGEEKRYFPVNDETFNPMSLDDLKRFLFYWRKYTAIQKEAIQSNFLSNEETDAIIEIQNLLSVEDVAQKLGLDIHGAYYKSINKVINDDGFPLGDAFTFAYMGFKRGINETKKFFNHHYNYEFLLVNEEEDDSGLSGRIIIEHNGFTSNGTSYIAGDAKITDFLIRVKYSMRLPDKTRKYIVDLMGDEVVENVEFPNIFSKAPFKNKISAFGKFHFLGADQHINMLHDAVASTIAPEVEVLQGYGFHEQYYACQNFVYDMRTKDFYEQDGDFYFNRLKRKGFMIVDVGGDNLAKNSQGIPRLNVHNKVYTGEDYYNFFKKLYKDDTGGFLFFFVLGMIYAGMFRHNNAYKFPYLILHGQYGTGKSAISDMIKRVYCIAEIEQAQTKYGETTPFSFLSICGNRKGTPVFITEFKEQDEKGGDAKVSNLISMFDRSAVTKGTTTQKLNYYNLTAIGVIDGEELPRRSAMKSRSIILRTKEKNNGLPVDEYKEAMNDPIIECLFYDCIKKDNYEADYELFMKQGVEYLSKHIPGAKPRVLECFCGVYAGVMMAFPELKPELERIILPPIRTQIEIEEATFGKGEILEIVKSHARQFTYNDCFFIDSEKRFCIRLDNLGDCIHRYHIKLSLGFNTVKDYFDNVDYVEDSLMGGSQECAIFTIDENFPRQLHFHPQAYDQYKHILKLKSNGTL